MGGCCTRERISNYFVNDGLKLVAIIIYALVGIGVFVERYIHYALPYLIDQNDPNRTNERQQKEALLNLLTHTLPIARASAAVIKWNSALILIFVLRNFLSWLRGTWFGSYFPVDKNIVFHKNLAWSIAIFTTLHCTAHYINFYNINNGTTQQLTEAGLATGADTATTIAAKIDPWRRAFTTLPGSTGVITCVAMLLMYSTAVDSVRRPSFEAFWYTHHLFIVYYALIIAHGQAALLEPATFWYWTIGPIFLYALERLIRILRGKQNCIILQAIAHPSRVLELRMKKTTFNYIPGQYVFLAAPYIADYEWHPFTISSSPDEDFVSCHIRLAGDWTGKLHALLNPNKKEGVVQENMVNAPNGKPIIMIDGPFGAASEDVFKFKEVMLWAAGIGVTPFASILKSIKYRIENDDATNLVRKVEFYWINREKTSFEWFLDLLVDLERKCPFLQINLYFTGKLSANEVRDAMYNKDSKVDELTGLESKTNFGRPDFDGIFAAKAIEFQGKTVGVFFCGPPIVSKKLYDSCVKSTNAKTNTKFIYHKENF